LAGVGDEAGVAPAPGAVGLEPREGAARDLVEPLRVREPPGYRHRRSSAARSLSCAAGPRRARRRYARVPDLKLLPDRPRRGLDQRRRGGGRSVTVPVATAAATPTVSESVGWGWIESATSSASAPISIASVSSATSSPAARPTTPAPSRRPLSGSRISFVSPS